MSLKFIKMFGVSILCTLFTLLPVSSVETFAALENIEQIGGAYGDLMDAKSQYKHEHPEDETNYECHHLIAKKALNEWGNAVYFYYDEQVTPFNSFLVDDKDQNWAPSITMEKKDHELTRSYWDPERSTHEQSMRSQAFIDEQAGAIIEEGNIVGVLEDEIDFIKQNFGNKYKRAIREVLDYIKDLQFRHRHDANGQFLCMINPEEPSWYIKYPIGMYAYSPDDIF